MGKLLAVAGALGVLALSLSPAHGSGRASEQWGSVRTIPLGAAPTAIAFARGSAWAATEHALLELDGTTGAVKRRIAIPPGGDYRHLAISGHAAWLTDGAGPRASITAVDLATRRVRRVTRLLCCAIGVATQAGDVWVTVPRDGPGLVVRIKAATGRVVARIPVGPGPGPIAISGSRVWVWNTSSPTSLMGIDPATNRVVETVALPGVNDIAAGPAGLWAAERVAGVVRLDPRSGRVMRPSRSAPGATQLVVGRTAVYAARTPCEGCAAGSVIRVQVGAGAVEPALRVGDTPIDLALGAGALWVANFASGSVTRVPVTRD